MSIERLREDIAKNEKLWGVWPEDWIALLRALLDEHEATWNETEMEEGALEQWAEAERLIQAYGDEP